MAQAKYSIMIPKADNLGNPLRDDFAHHCHDVLFQGPLKVEGSFVDPDKMGFWRDDAPEPHDILTTYAEDSPQMDSEMKRLAMQIADAANQWGIFIAKEGKSGVQSWVVNNNQFRQGEPAIPEALAQSGNAV